MAKFSKIEIKKGSPAQILIGRMFVLGFDSHTVATLTGQPETTIRAIRANMTRKGAATASKARKPVPDKNDVRVRIYSMIKRHYPDKAIRKAMGISKGTLAAYKANYTRGTKVA